MEIILYENLSEPNRLTKNIVEIARITGTLREACSVISPTISFSNVNVEFVVDNDDRFVVDNEAIRATVERTQSLAKANYVYIPVFERYYYVDNKTWVRNNLLELDMSVDVLMSFKSDITNIGGIVDRQEFDFNSKLVDGLLPCEIGYSYSYKKGTMHYQDYTFAPSFNGTSTLIVCTVANIPLGNASESVPVGVSNGYSNVYIIPLYPNGMSLIRLLIAPNTILQSFTSIFTDKSEYITNMYILPFNPIQGKETYYSVEQSSIFVGKVDGTSVEPPFWYYMRIPASDIGLDKVKQLAYNRSLNLVYTCTINISDDINSFLHHPPYTKYELNLPFFGVIELDIERLIANSNSTTVSVSISYYLDLTTGMCDIVIHNGNINSNYEILDKYGAKNSSSIIQTFRGSIGYKIPFGKSGVYELYSNYWQTATSVTLSALSAGLSAGLGSSISNMFDRRRKKGDRFKARQIRASELNGGVERGVGIVNSTINDVLSLRATPERQSSDGGELYTFRNLESPLLIISTPKYVEPENYAHFFGKPSMEYRMVNELSGYTKYANVHVENIHNATSDELDEIEENLLSGILI